MGKRRVTGSLNHSPHVPQTSYERKEAASVCWCSVPVQFTSQVFVSTGECTWINRNTEQHDLFAGCCHAPVAKSIILTTLPHNAPHIIWIPHLARAAHFQDSTMSRDFRNKVLQRDVFADCPICPPTYQDSKRDHPGSH